MTDQPEQQPRDVLDQMAEAVRSWPAPDGPPPHVRQAVLALGEEPPRPKLKHTGSIRYMQSVVKLAALAAAAVVVISIFVWPHGGSTSSHGVAFADVQRQVDAARTIVYTKQREENGKIVGEAKVTIDLAGRTRTDVPGVSYSIADYPKGLRMQLKEGPKTVTVLEVKPETPPDMLAELRQMIQSDSPKALGEKQVNGRKAKGYLLTKEGDTLEVWVDAATALPIRATVDRPTSRIIVADFAFNVSLDESVFNPAPPDGYRVVRADMNPEHASEKDVLEELKLLAEHHDGSFPDQGLGQAMMQYSNDLQQYLKDHAADQPKEVLEQLEDGLQMKGALAGRVMQFNRGKWDYSGSGVKLGDADKPIFWYKPEGAEKYRVIFGDLNVRELDASQLSLHRPATKPSPR